MDAINCPICGSENPANATHCQHCRVNLKLAQRDPEEIRRAKRTPIEHHEGRSARENILIAAKIGLAVLSMAGFAIAIVLSGSYDASASWVGKRLVYCFLGLWALCAIWVLMELGRVKRSVAPSSIAKAIALAVFSPEGVGLIVLAFIVLLAVLVAPVALIVLAFIANAEVCPYCEGRIAPQALKCPHCGSDLTTANAPGHPDQSQF